MTPFFITGLPRSRTAWLANLFTSGDSFCFHDGLKEGFSVTRLCEKMLRKKEYKYVGDSDSALMFHWHDVQQVFPEAKWLFIKRPIDHCRKSFVKHFKGDSRFMPQGVDVEHVFDICQQNYKDALDNLNGSVLECDYEDLNSLMVIEKLIHWLTPEARIDLDRLAALQEFSINIIPEKVELWHLE